MASEIERQQREDRQWNSYKNTSVIRGHHIYKSVWTQIIGEMLVLVPEDNKEHNKHAVAVMKDGCIVGHITRSICQVSWSFLNIVATLLHLPLLSSWNSCCMTSFSSVVVPSQMIVQLQTLTAYSYHAWQMSTKCSLYMPHSHLAFVCSLAFISIPGQNTPGVYSKGKVIQGNMVNYILVMTYFNGTTQALDT